MIRPSKSSRNGLAERVNSGTNPGDLAERVNSGTNPGDMIEKVNSGTNPGDLAERVNSGTNPGDLAERVNSSTNPGDLAGRVNSGTNPGDLAERVNSGINPGDLAERVNSGTNLGDLAERVNSGTNPGDLAEGGLSVFSEQVGMTSSDSSSSVRVISSSGSGGVSLGDPEASPLGASSGPPSPVDARDLRDLEIMKVDHDLDTAVTEGSLAVIRERHSIPAEYGLHVPRSGQRPYSSDVPGICISVDALEAGLRFPLYPLIEECLRWWRISPSQVAPNSWRYLVFLGECRGVGIIPTRDLFMACFRLCKSRGGYYLTARVGFRVSGAPSNNKDRMDLGDLRGMPKVSGGKTSSVRAAAPAQEVDVSPAREAPKISSKRPIDAPTEQVNDSARRQKKVKVLTRRHKSRHGEGGSRSHSKGKEPIAPAEEPETPMESDEGDASPVHHLPRSMKDLFKTKVHKDDAGYYALHMSDLAYQDPDKEMKAREESGGGAEKLDEGLERLVGRRGVREGTSPPTVGAGAVHAPLGGFAGPSRQGDGFGKFSTLMVLFDRVHDAGQLITFMDYHISNLQQELDTIKSGGGPEAVVKAEEQLNEVPSNLTEIQRLLKEARVRARKMDDELLQSVKALENAQAELPRQAVDRYKESAGFKEGLKRMGRVTYEYGYRVAIPSAILRGLGVHRGRLDLRLLG
ncbi:hypothetical protein B296_00051616 [Ensete ventricosum]|uniref:Transposase (putative) gypsy type domain-containing protein n=1 Tax=Ensete ventricosum TaxID=4639 RepID=A0A426Y4T9_ENSVE|nr:hypothetical protein B296_00051616 [Ensete ventricosum]